MREQKNTTTLFTLPLKEDNIAVLFSIMLLFGADGIVV
ncbi:uncharacterized protein METZ01_LOCUS478983 [marine metagenome]|uniref:Uncharacterized protein n=1 Tax=marine metagenome TaxID=408172 RepID=A0A383C234_9ZZZZ